jgi:hypothetical protein
MVTLSSKVRDALNEVRILILGAQIVLGFQFQAAFQPRFSALPSFSRWLNSAAYGLMLLAVILLIAPAPYHRIVEHGNDTLRLLRFATRMAAIALGPFALCIGIDEFLVASAMMDKRLAATAASLVALVAVIAWYVIESARRKSPAARHRSEREESMRASVEEKISTMSTEIRVILPGAQAVLGFQFSVVLSDAFDRLPQAAKLLHLASLTCVAGAVVLLIAPAAYHRIVAGGEDYRDVEFFGARAMLLAMVILGLGMAGDFYLVLGMISDWHLGAAIAAILALLVNAGLWFGYPLAIRRRNSPIG